MLVTHLPHVWHVRRSHFSHERFVASIPFVSLPDQPAQSIHIRKNIVDDGVVYCKVSNL